jgi:hypothetical protein
MDSSSEMAISLSSTVVDPHTSQPSVLCTLYSVTKFTNELTYIY